MTKNNQEPVAWAFYNKDGTLRFIIDDKARMIAWKDAHDGYVVPLVQLVSEEEEKENRST